MGVSPWKRNPRRAESPEGTAGTATASIPVAPSGLRIAFDPRSTGLHPWLQHTVPSGLACSRPIALWEPERWRTTGVTFGEKMATQTATLVDQFIDAANHEETIHTNMKSLGFELPIGGKK
ncbi:MAG: hypothetical protein AAFN77_03800 [Planctomycetota bacterium]